MVEIDITQWPTVYVEMNEIKTLPEMQEYVEKMNELLDYAEQQADKYGVIYLYQGAEQDPKSFKREKEAQKLNNQWLKENKARVGEHCVAIAMVTPFKGMMKLMRPIARMSMKRMMGAPGDMFFNKEEAEKWMAEKLNVL
ncbi:MAG: hypothetical protein AAF702_06580 [Chloroflexota bacterium]